MPLYEYECKKCKFKIEKIQKISDPPLQICERCNGPLKKKFSSPNIRFKGAGWYATDYAKKTDTKDEMKGEMKEVKKEEQKSSQIQGETHSSSSSSTSTPVSPNKSTTP